MTFEEVNNLNLIVDKYYWITWIYKKKEYTDYMCFIRLYNNKYYSFKDDKGCYISLKAKELINIK